MFLKNKKKSNSLKLHSTTTSLTLHYGSPDYIMNKLDDEFPTFGTPYPNPARDNLTIPVHISEQMGKTRVSIEVYNSMGKKVATVTENEYLPGSHAIHWSPDQPLGLYVLKMRVGIKMEKLKVVVEK